MGWEPLDPAWTRCASAIDVASHWADSGGQWLTDPHVGVPQRLVTELADLVAYLDGHGARLAEEFPAGGVGVIGERAALQRLRRSGTSTAGGAGRLLRCIDGWIALSLARDEDRELVAAWLEADGQGDLRWTWDDIARRVAERSAADVRDRAALLGLPCSVVGEVVDRSPVLVDRKAVAPARPIRGMTVVSLASLWAGPLAADVLARAGADVITVESTTRPDGAREVPKFFAALHGRGRCVALPLATVEGQRDLRSLLARADVVIEGSRPRALHQMGIDAARMIGAGTQLWVSITSHGRSAPNDHRIGFGDDAAAAGGLVGWVEGSPRFVADAVADPLTGLTVAAAILQLVGAGTRALVDVALPRTAARVAVPGDPRGQLAPLPSPSPPRSRRVVNGSPLLGRDTAEVLARDRAGSPPAAFRGHRA